MNRGEILLLLFVAVCVLLVGAAVAAAFDESQPSPRGQPLVEYSYGATAGAPTSTATPSVLGTADPNYTPSFAPAQEDEGAVHQHRTPRVTATEDFSPGADN